MISLHWSVSLCLVFNRHKGCIINDIGIYNQISNIVTPILDLLPHHFAVKRNSSAIVVKLPAQHYNKSNSICACLAFNQQGNTLVTDSFSNSFCYATITKRQISKHSKSRSLPNIYFFILKSKIGRLCGDTWAIDYPPICFLLLGNLLV